MNGDNMIGGTTRVAAIVLRSWRLMEILEWRTASRNRVTLLL